jgi:hypothetical protein
LGLGLSTLMSTSGVLPIRSNTVRATLTPDHPPATAGRIDTTSPAASAVSSLSR